MGQTFEGLLSFRCALATSQARSKIERFLSDLRRRPSRMFVLMSVAERGKDYLTRLTVVSVSSCSVCNRDSGRCLALSGRVFLNGALHFGRWLGWNGCMHGPNNNISI